jgi:hypothetical protein
MGLERKSKEARDKASKHVNQHGEEPPTTRTPAKRAAHQVPATEQSVITPKGKTSQKTQST